MGWFKVATTTYVGIFDGDGHRYVMVSFGFDGPAQACGFRIVVVRECGAMSIAVLTRLPYFPCGQDGRLRSTDGFSSLLCFHSY